MHSARTTTLIALSALLLGPPLACAGLISGGTGKSDCYVGIDVTAVESSSSNVQNGKKIVCTDGDPCDQGECGDGACDFEVALCINQTDPAVPACTPPAKLEKLQVKGKLNIEIPQVLEGASCGTVLAVPISTKKGGKKPGKAVFNVVAKAPKGTKPRTDNDKFTLVCQPRTTPCGSGQCTREAPGLPAKLVAEVPPTGSDLDNGFSGASHNFVITAQSKLNYCLSNCDGVSDVECDASGATGAGTDNGTTWGAPLPLLSTNVPVCVVNVFRNPTITGAVNLQSGEMSTTINLFAETYVRPGKTNDVCPRCDGGKCSAGKREGLACTVNGTSTVTGSPNPNYNLSTDCLPEGQPAGRLLIDLPLTNTQPAVSPPGPKPCAAAVGQTQDDRCAAGATCNAANCTTQIGEFGGLQQTCCSAPSNTPCFPTRSGGTIVREGSVAQYTPAFPDTTYPKQSTGTVLAATFCIAKTTDPTVDNLTGLPGPGAILVPLVQTITASEAPAE